MKHYISSNQLLFIFLLYKNFRKICQPKLFLSCNVYHITFHPPKHSTVSRQYVGKIPRYITSGHQLALNCFQIHSCMFIQEKVQQNALRDKLS